jgi:hypothetical protein
MGIDINYLPLSHYVDILRDGGNFSFSRWGDGEWLTVIGYYGQHNSNGCTFTPELSAVLNDVLQKNNPYYFGMLKISVNRRSGEIVPYIERTGIDIDWVDGDVFLEESLDGNLFPLIEQIRKRRVLYVGNERLRGLNMRDKGFFPYVVYVQPPPIDAFGERERILDQVVDSIERYNIDFVGWSSGLAAKYFIDQVFEEYGYSITQLDFGSMFDGYFEPLPHIQNREWKNKASRSYILRYDFDKLLTLNTGG